MLGDHLPALFHPFANTLPKLLGALANGLAAFLAEVFSQAYTLFRLLAGQLLEFFKILLGLLADLLQPALPAFSLLNDLGLQYPSNLWRLTSLVASLAFSARLRNCSVPADQPAAWLVPIWWIRVCSSSACCSSTASTSSNRRRVVGSSAPR